MEKRKSQFICIPISIWASKELDLTEKAVLIEMYSLSGDDGGYNKPLGRLSAALSLPKHVVNDAVVSLQKKGAITLSMALNGDTIYTPHIERKRFVSEKKVEEPKIEEETKAIDYLAVLQEWKRTNPELTQPRCFTPKMQQQLRNLLKNNRTDIEGLYRVFRAIGCSDFLQGRRGEWKADLNWLLRDSKGCFLRIENGEFHRSEQERIALDEIFSPTQNTAQDGYYR